MKVSAKLRYTVRTLCEIGEDPKSPMSLKKIEKIQKISANYLKQILQPLEKTGIIGSIRGKYGGYYLKRKLTEIKLYDIILALNEQNKLSPCLHDGECTFERKNFCGSHGKWGELQGIINKFYKNTNLSDFKD